ncbi:MAG: FMN-binding protein [Clostridiales bacterium 38-18]|nr:MAG: FMN-binding protein [Clostridiales bacterium 38-18]
MLSEKFYEVLKNEGVVSIVSWGEGEPHIVNTWNSFIVVTEDQRLLMPAWAFRRTEKNIDINQQVKIALGSKAVEGYNNYQGTGFIINGTGRFISEGEDYDMMKEKFSFLTRVLEVTVTSAKQML